ncbi:DNA repair protein RAD16 isoform X4 [Citrus sinensis]|uniref:DNA repair protein RAD16 isoform X4 n=1 Tax=Citrus sinensis TaxID=2711 RepID=UPI002278312E|nr:DNA repair protein RAD16 isoform X4 [Citrus sinensis]
MELRSRKTIGQSSGSGNGDAQGKQGNSGEGDSKGKGIIDLSDVSDDEIYVPSSDSDSFHSDDECKIYGDRHILKLGLSLETNNLTSSSVTGEFSIDLNAEPAAEREEVGPSNLVYCREQPAQAKGKKNESNKKKKTRGKKRQRTGSSLLWEIWEEEHERWIDMHEKDDVDLDQQNAFMTETAEDPPDLITPLLRYQKEWLAWALKQEESAIRGGILADEMGMGKTIQAIALVLAKREIRGTIGELDASSSSSTGLLGIKATLVICPVAAVTQWVSEINRFTSVGSTKVLIYHGLNRERSTKQFSEFDFVITTYSIIEADYRKHVMPPKQKCQYCGKSFYQKKLVVHLKYFCGPSAVRTEKQSKQEKKKMKSSVYEGYPGKKNGKKSSVGGVQKPSGGKSPLHSLKWERIILDEAHFIKDRRSNTAKAVLALESSYKWALSGTPLQNRVGELYSLVRFLQITPYSYYFCKDCDCKVLDYSSAECPNCPHNSVRHFCWWNRYVATPIQTHGNSYGGRRAMILLKHKVLRSVILRRTKKGRAADLALPPRIAVDHPYLVVYSKTASLRGETEADAEHVQQVCGLCNDLADDPVVTNCGHAFCKACLFDSSASKFVAKCPTCSIPLTVDFTANEGAGNRTSKTTIKGFKSSSILNRIQLDEFQSSTKIEALREEIRFMVERDGSAKGIVFSQFTSFLDLINYSLHKSGVNCVQLVGSMSIPARDAAINRFTEDPHCKIFLMSLKAGGVALNLTVASHVFLMDPWWNPAVEQQAQDRIHRIGQYKPIRIVRFLIENTIEERILKLQEKKKLVFEGTVGGSADAFGKLTEADMRFLFVT